MAKRINYSKFVIPVTKSKTGEIVPTLLSKLDDVAAVGRMKTMAAQFSTRLPATTLNRPTLGKTLNPFVLSAHAWGRGYKSPEELDRDLVVSKSFSSWETSVGRMIEDIAPQTYGWTQVDTPSHDPRSETDSAKITDDKALLVALKSGPSCINDTMSLNIGNAIANHYKTWAEYWDRNEVEYIIGRIYATPKMSNKKDHAILRLARESCFLPFARYGSAGRPSPKRNLEAHQALRPCTDCTRNTGVRAFHRPTF